MSQTPEQIAHAAKIDRILAKRRAVSPEGREALAKAVQIDHDWALPCSSADMLIEALGGMSDADLEAAYLLMQSMTEAIACIRIRRAPTKLPHTPPRIDTEANARAAFAHIEDDDNEWGNR